MMRPGPAFFLAACLLCAHLCCLLSAENDAQSSLWACDRPWPELELFLPVLLHDKGRAQEWKELFLRSYLLFWPVAVSRTKLLFVVDEEQRGHSGVDFLQDTLNNHSVLSQHSRITYNNPPKHVYGGGGHNRQQYLMFWADNFTKSEFVGFVDTDCLFLTYVDREDIFEDGKPVVIGKSGDPNKRFNRDPLWRDITATTFDLLGVLEPMKCMAYFPVVVKTAHLRKLRRFLENKFKKPFEDVFREHILSRRYSQFNIFCAYLFHFHKEDYTWYASDLSPEWDFNNPTYGQEANRTAYTEKMRYPKPRIATHARYHAPPIVGAQHAVKFAEQLQSGICFSPPFPKPEEYYPCNFYRTENDFQSEVFEEMHRFEWSDFTSIVRHHVLADAAYTRFQRFRHCPHDFGRNENISKLMEVRMPLEEGSFIYTQETGRSIFYYANGTLRGFPNYDTFLAMGGGQKSTTMLTHRQFKNIPKGPQLPPIAGRRHLRANREP